MSESFYKLVVVLLLIMNTFFIGGIWRAVACQPCGYKKGSICPLSKTMMGKICPITGKKLQAGAGESM